MIMSVAPSSVIVPPQNYGTGRAYREALVIAARGRCTMAPRHARIERQHVINSKAQPCAAEVIRSTRGTSACPKRDKTWVLAAAVLGSTMAFVDESVVKVALPTIEADLHNKLA